MYIERAKAKQAIWDAEWEDIADTDVAYDAINNVPAADVAPVVHGRWEPDGKDHCHCSHCCCGRNTANQIWWRYCPNCGAKMQKEQIS